MEEFNVLSLFDGMACGRQALKNLGISVTNYFASEIDKSAITIAAKNHPDITHVGDATQLKCSNGRLLHNGKSYKIHLIIGGSPCQGFSFAGKQLNFSDPRSRLFFEFVRLVKELQPNNFLLENVKMKKEYQDVITQYLGVTPVLINSARVSAQNRQRLYWTTIQGVTQPDDLGIQLRDILDIEEGDKLYNYSSSGRGNGKVEDRVSEAHKAGTLTAAGYSKRSATLIVQLNPSKEAAGK